MNTSSPTLAEATRVWARIALLSFGGPAGQIALMHRVLVDEKRWIGERRFLHALSFCTLLPGPEAQQLATYIGWLMHRTAGGLIAGGLFVLPGLVSIMALSWLYVLLGDAAPIQGLFFGLKAAVVAIVLQAMVRLASRALVGAFQRAIAILAFLALFFLDVPFPLVVIGAGLLGFAAVKLGLFAGKPGGHGAATAGLADEASLLGAALPPHARPGERGALWAAFGWLVAWLIPVAALALWLGPDHVQSRVAIFFSQMAVVTFGGAYAALAYVAQAAVETYHWLRPGEMLDGLGLAETTPGPLIMVLQFVGFLAAYRDPGALPPLLAGTLGGLIATWVTFAPCFLWIFLGAPYVERLRKNEALAGALSAITAAVVGVIANLALWFTLHTVFGEVRKLGLGPIQLELPALASVNWPALLLALAATIAVLRFKTGLATTLVGCALAGIAIKFLA